MKNLTIFSNEVSIEHISAMDKQGTLWLSKILSKGQEKSQYYNISLQTSMKKKMYFKSKLENWLSRAVSLTLS